MRIDNPMFPPGHPAAKGPLLSIEQQILNTLIEIRDLLRTHQSLAQAPAIVVQAKPPRKTK